MKLAEGNRVLWLDPETNREFKATIERIFKVKARITLTDLTTKSVAIEELELAPLRVRTFKETSIPSMSSISTRDIEPNGVAIEPSSSISTREIELSAVAIEPESSITPPVIEPHAEDDPRKSSITLSVIEPLVIEPLPLESSITRLGFNVYWVKKPNGKKFEYWRYSYRVGAKVKHKHVGSFERMRELRELPGWKISALLGLP